jgi:hypothetical protein
MNFRINWPFGSRNSQAENQPQNIVTNQPVKDNGKKPRLNQKISAIRNYHVDMGLDIWDRAIKAAEYGDFPDFREYYDLIREVLKRDGRLRAQIKIAINKVLDEPWAIVDVATREIDKEATDLMSTKMFYDIMRAHIEAELYGTRIVELGQPIQKETGWEIASVFTIPQTNINPGLGRIYMGPADSEGFPYREDPFNTYLIEAGDPDDLGLYQVATYLAILKKFALLDWSRSGEKFMDPIIILQTDSDNESELKNKESWLKSMGKDPYGIFDKDDDLKLVERNGQQAFMLVQKLAEFLNTEMAESINAQAATTEQKAWAGAAQVQERILDSFTTARMRGLMFHINDVVIPKLMTIDNGMYVYAKALKGKKFMPIQLLKELRDPNLPDPGATDPNGDPNNPAPGKPTPPNAGAKKKPEATNWQRFDPIAGGF